MFSFHRIRSWKWPTEFKKPLVLVDGEPVGPGAGTGKGNSAYVVTVNEKNAQEALERIDVEALYLYEYRCSSLQPLSHLKNLKHLRIEWAIKLTGYSEISEFENLETLHIDDVPKAQDLEPIAALKKLVDFEFSGGVWNKNTALSLEPLTLLPNLARVVLLNLKVCEGGLRPLARCKNLRELDVSNQFELDDFAFLAGTRPDIACKQFTAWLPLLEDLAMVTGKKQPTLNLKTDGEKIRRAEERFERLKRQYADGR